jgi:hypothetical protein
MATAPPSSKPLSEEELHAALISELSELSDDELQQRYKEYEQLLQRLQTSGPQTRDELHGWIKDELGLDIPRVAVCPDHQAPFEVLADLYFEVTLDGDIVDAALVMANRGGSKTFLIALLHYINSRFKPGVESCTFGAVEAQSFRAYNHLKGWIYDDHGNKRPEIVSSLMKETYFTNGSKIEVLGSTPEAVNGPHPHKAHADEIELMREDTFTESRNMTVAGRTKDGREITPQDILTSTRKGPSGRMQQLIDEIDDAKAKGLKPPRRMYAWCIFETAAQIKNCQVALGLNPDDEDYQGCDCHIIPRGEWENGKTRLLRDVCQGRFYKSRGWQPKIEVEKQFRENDRITWETQQECRRPEMKWHYVPNWSDERHCIREFEPDPLNGPIFLAVDWGGTNPSAVNWYQLLNYEIEVAQWIQPLEDQTLKVRLDAGFIVCFDEIYIAETGATKLADMVIAKETRYRQRFGSNWAVEERFADPQGKMARKDWAYHSPPLATKWHTTRKFDEHIDVVSEIFDMDIFRVVGDKCPMFVREIKAWRRDEKTGKQIDEFNHAMSNFRYALSNMKALRQRHGFGKGKPMVEPRQRATPGVTTVQASGTGPGEPLGYAARGDQFDQWRQGLGSPVTRR